jgi:sec-independent protein translocase protein TatC
MSDAPKPENRNPEGVATDEAAGTFLSHLLELRNRLLYSVMAIGVVLVALLPFANDVYEFLATPLLRVMPQGASMIATDVVAPFFTPLKLTLAAAVAISVPFLLYQIWAFVAPGLYKHERRLVAPLIISSTLLFYGGMAFAYYVVFPVVFEFFVLTAPKGVVVMTDIKAYLDFVFTMFFAFGVAFEVPVAVVLLTRLGVIKPRTLAAKRPYVILGIFVIAAVLTPPDVLSQSFLALPMWGLFEIGLFVARRIAPAEEPAEDAPQG